MRVASAQGHARKTSTALPLPRTSTGTSGNCVEALPVAKPKLPTAQKIFPWLQRIDQTRIYANWGPLNTLLEERLGSSFGGYAVTVSSGTAGLICALLGVCGERPAGLCLMPSWTFVATAQAALAAGLTPCFIDPDEMSWAITPKSVEKALAGLLNSCPSVERRVSAVIAVAPFGSPIDPDPWDDFVARTGIPVVIDAAAAVDGLRAGRVPAVVSLHATKCLAAGEGGFIVTRDADLIKRIKRAANFGFFGSRSAEVPGLNAKLSEYHAAVALASLDSWPEERAQWLQVARRLRGPLVEVGCALLPGWGEHWVSSTCVVRLPAGLSAEEATLALGLRGIVTRAWWGRGCHAQPAFAKCPRWPPNGDLPVTERLAASTLGLPFYLDLPVGAEQRIATALHDAAHRSRAKHTSQTTLS